MSDRPIWSLPKTSHSRWGEPQSLIQRGWDRLCVGLTGTAGLGVVVLLGAIALMIAARALPAIQTYGLGFILGREWNPAAGREAFGALPLIWGTGVSSAIALLLAVPLGIGTAIFLSEAFLPIPIRNSLGFAVELLAAIPSVVYGLWGLQVLVPWLMPWARSLHETLGGLPLFGTPPLGPGLLPAALVLTLMIVPMIAAIARDSLLALPFDLRLAARSVGTTRWEAIAHIFLPAAASGIWGGVLLALGRALGETMAIALLIGNVPQISLSLFAPATTIAATLANQFAAAKDMHIAALMYAALILLGMTLTVNGVAVWMMQGQRGGQGKRRMGGWGQTPALRRWGNAGMSVAITGCALATVVPLGLVLGFVAVRGSRRLDGALFTQLPPAAGLSGGGIANAILGSLLVVGLATAIALPIGLLAGMYLADICPSTRMATRLRLVVNVLSGLPSILAGVFAYGWLVVSGVVGFSAIAGAVALAVVMLPLIIRTTDEALQQVETDIRWAAASVGASPVQALLGVILPAAQPAILTGVLLAIARAAGETAPLLFTALNSDFFPRTLTDPIATLSVLIYNFAIAPFPAQQDLAWAASLVLVATLLALNLAARWLTRRIP